MDIYNMYVGDCTSSFRHNMLRDYEKHPYGTFEGNYQQQQLQRKSYYAMVQGKICPFSILYEHIPKTLSRPQTS